MKLATKADACSDSLRVSGVAVDHLLAIAGRRRRRRRVTRIPMRVETVTIRGSTSSALMVKRVTRSSS